MSRSAPFALSLLLLAGTAQAQPPATAPVVPRDRFEGFNRAVWGFNQGIDRVVLKPVSSVYRTVAPRPARRGIGRVFSNLSEPFSAINALLQGKPKRAFNSLARFVVNTTIGVGGLADHATGMGLKQTPEDFGQTLAAWGVRSSAYIVLPILGPSTVRDGVGAGAAQFLDPYRVCLRTCGLPRGLPLALNALEVTDTRAQLTDSGADDFLATSADPYATARSAFFQRRAAQIADQDDAATPAPGSDDAALDAALAEIDGQGGEAAPAPRQDVPQPVGAPPASGTVPPVATPQAAPPRLPLADLSDEAWSRND